MARLSLAQTLPPELLTRIFGWLVEISVRPKMGNFARSDVLFFLVPARCATLRAASLVCRQWRSPGQQTLFRFLDLTQGDLEGLLSVVTTHPDLARAVRAVHAGIDSEHETRRFPTAEEQRFVDDCTNACRILAACDNVKHLVLRGFMRETQARLIGVLDSIELESLGFGEDFWSSSWHTRLYELSPNDLTALVQKPTLRHLEMRCSRALKAYRAPFLPLSFVKPSSNVTTLALNVEYPSFALRLIQLVATTLLDLRIYTECIFPDGQAINVFERLELLRRLDFADNSLGPEFTARNSWLITAIPRLPSLRELRVGDDYEPSRLLQALQQVTHLSHRFRLIEPHAKLVSFRDALRATANSLRIRSLFVSDYPMWDRDARAVVGEIVTFAASRGMAVVASSSEPDQYSYLSFFWYVDSLPMAAKTC
ncbi:hypothetical protein NBRC10512_006694 [Rhodotorula toruloides]|nr:uncharacterized protein RHTO_05532 [Rhodotorula toruloides NP11]EMS18964.1 hypothetical protein RHTO_05532 [Rhodotorula toruloides NP11]